MDLRSYLDILWRYKSVILITTVLTLLVAVGGAQFVEPQYRATVTLRLLTATRGSTDWVDYDLDYADRLMNTYAQIARSVSLREQLMAELALRQAPEVAVDVVANTELMKIRVENGDPVVVTTAANMLATILIDESTQSALAATQGTQSAIVAAMTQAEQRLATARQTYQALRAATEDDANADLIAAEQAVALAERSHAALVEQYQLSQVRDALQTPMLTVLDPATVPTQPFQPNLLLVVLLGLALGLVGGLVIALVMENLAQNRTMATGLVGGRALPALPAQTNSTASRALMPPATMPSALSAQIAPARAMAAQNGSHRDNGHYDKGHYDKGHYDKGHHDNGHNKSQHSNGQHSNGQHSAAHHSVHQLRDLSWQLLNEGRQQHSLLVASIVPFAQSTQLVVDLATSLAQHGKKVVVVDCDFRKPQLQQLLQLPNEVGLSSLLLQQSSLGEALWLSQTKGIHVIPTGPMAHQPEELLASSALDIVFNILTMQFDIVLVNAPPLSVAADAVILARHVQGILLSIDEQQYWSRYEPMVEAQFAQVSTPLMGVVMQPAAVNGLN